MPGTALCPACEEVNDAAQRFCGHCGASLSWVCAACRHENPPGFRYCGACGAPSPAGPARAGSEQESGGERRWITVMFADLSGFTALSERSDPEEVRAMVDRSMAEMGEVVGQFGGSVDKVIGDAMMAVFGAPVAHEDDPERAVRCALEIQRRAAEQAETFGGLCVRIGVNTGEVIFAPVGPEGRRELTVMGDTVNVAARLQAAAPPEGVVVGEQTHAACARSVACEPMEPILAKGKTSPVRAWLALAATAAPAERPLSAAQFVGRDGELELLMGMWARSCSEKHPRLVTLVGLPGIGKTRLARELALRVEEDGGRTLRGRPLPYGEPAAYSAFGQLIREACGILATDSAEIAAQKLAERTQPLLAEPEAHHTATHLAILASLTDDSVAERQALFASAQRFLEALALEQPTLVLLEDLQWADDSLLELLEALSVRTTGAPLLLLVTARPELLDARPSWARVPTNVMVQLSALTPDSTRELAARLLRDGADGDAAVARVEKAAGGNPLFIEELAAWLAEGGGASGDHGLPSTVKMIIAARLDQLPVPERQVILDASVVGEFFWRGSLEALRPGAALAQRMQELERRDLIRRSPSSRISGDEELAFKHGLIREVAYATLPKAVREERHGVVARFLERAAGNPATYASILAHHWRQAGDALRASDYLLIAAQQAGRGWAYREAVDLCDQALELIPGGDQARRRRALMVRAVALQSARHVAVDLPRG
jgi:class 3 adenylate cyclase